MCDLESLMWEGKLWVLYAKGWEDKSGDSENSEEESKGKGGEEEKKDGDPQMNYSRAVD